MMKSFYTISFFILSMFGSLIAQDGTLDTNFGMNGTISIDNPSGDAEIFSIVKIGDKIIGTGFTTFESKQVISMIGFNLDGTLNTGFGDNGMLILPLGSGSGRASSLVVQSDGKILAGGWARHSNKDLYVIVRFSEDGVLDDSFGENGVTKGFFSSSSFAEDEVAEIGLLSDGKIVITGRSYGGLSDDVFVGCFNTDGSLFTDFGTDGFSIIDFDQSPPSELATCMSIDEQDNIFIGGKVSVSFSDEDAFFILKLNNLGVADNTFGDSGKVIKALSSDVIAGINDLEIDNQGRIVTGGGAFNTDELDNNFFLTRHLPSGMIDNSFGNNGVVIIQKNSNESISDLEVLASGDIIAAGSTGGFASRYAVVRLGNNGVQDLTFGNNGWATTLIESTFNGIESIIVEEECIYAAGSSYDGDNFIMTMAKYINEGVVGVEELLIEDKKFQVYPSLVSSNFTIAFDLRESTDLSLQLFDVNGRLVQELISQKDMNIGEHQLNFMMPNELSKGSYIVVLNAENEMMSKKIQYHKR